MPALRSLLASFLIGMPFLLHAQEVRVDTLRAVRPWGTAEVYTFPKLVMRDRPAVAAAINKDLCVDLLEADPDTTAPGAIFTQVWGDSANGPMPRLNSITWTTARPFRNVFTVRIEAEGCGAYCEGFTAYRSYDLRSGHRLDFDSLFTPEGVAELSDTLDRRWRRAVEGHIRALADTLLRPGLSADDRDWSVAAREMYRTCMGERPEGRPYITGLQPLPEGLRCWVARCSGHVDLAVDDLLEVPLELPYAWLESFLQRGWRGLFSP